MSHSRAKTCAYCGRPAETRDHIPPKALFPQPLPDAVELVTVPCCHQCNQGVADDDKYFATVLSSSIAAQGTAEGRAVWERLVSGGRRHPEEKGFWKGIRRNIRVSEIHSPGGIILGSLPGHRRYEPRFYSVLERIVKGFFFKLSGTQLPSEYRVVIWESPTQELWEQIPDVREGLLANGCFQPMHNVFRLWSTTEKQRPSVTMWYMVFLEAKDFLCLTAPKEEWGLPSYLQPGNP